MDNNTLEMLKKYSDKYKFVYYDECSGQMMASNDYIVSNIKKSNKDGFNFKLVDKKYLIRQGLNIDTNVLQLLDKLQDKRSLIVNYDEYLVLSEFLFLHDSEFKVTNVYSDLDRLALHLL